MWSCPIHSAGAHGQVVEPIAPVCEPYRTALLWVVLNHNSVEVCPLVGTALLGTVR